MKTNRIDFLVDGVKLLLVILISFLMISIIILFVSGEPQVAIYNFFIGPFTSVRRVGNILEGAIPLIFTSLAVIIIFRVGLFSMISEGCFFIGSMAAMIIGIKTTIPVITPLLAILLSAVLGALVAAIPGILKYKWNVTEVVTSIMLNYIIQFFVIYMVSYHFREPLASSLASLKISDAAQLPVIIGGTKVHLGLVIALLSCLFVWYYLYRLKIGYKIRVVGANNRFASYTGINAGITMLFAQIVAGAIAGIGGGVEMLGMYSRFKWTSSPGYGWTGIAVALLAHSNPLLVPIAAIFMAYLDVGSAIMARNSDVNSEIVMIIQGVMLLLIAANTLLSGWRQRMVVANTNSAWKATK